MVIPFELPKPFEKPRLYALVRNDLASLNSGKAVAQAMHAAGTFAEMMVQIFTYMDHDDSPYKKYEDAVEPYREWAASAGMRRDHHPDMSQGFGVTLALEVNENQMRQINEAARNLGLPCGIAHDPDYPLRDGETVHLIPLDTVGFVFIGEAASKVFFSRFGLMP